MNQTINAVTIAVDDIKLLKKFYHEVLEWAVLAENIDVIMFKLNQMVLTLCSADTFTNYTGLPPGNLSSKGFYFTINFDTPKQVDESFKKLMKSKVHIAKMPQQTFWGGYSGFFADPEGNHWEICYNPVPGTKV
jgi:uncharacterized glyoxalase superfamily protein PhnB